MLSYRKKKYRSNGKEGLKANYKKVDLELRVLEDENARLKKIIANHALELEFKIVLVKKAIPITRKSVDDCLVQRKGRRHVAL